ncbi:MAG: TSUP family transporter, partial [Gammaproteobacteria bacterium]
LILFAALLLAIQEPIKTRLIQRAAKHGIPGAHELSSGLPIALSAVYGGYFGAGLGVIMLATLGITLDDTLTRLNALKQVLSLAINLAAAVYFALSGPVLWPAVAVMAVGALAGGALGGRVASRIKPASLRYGAVAIGLFVGGFYLFK